MYEMENVSFEEIEKSSQRLQQLAVRHHHFRPAGEDHGSSAAQSRSASACWRQRIWYRTESGASGSKKTSTTANLLPTTSCGWYREYGSDQGSLFTTAANSQAIVNLDVSKALALTVLPAEEREEFVAEHDVENMSTRELKDALQENKELKRQLEEKEKQISQASVQLDTAISERQKIGDPPAGARSTRMPATKSLWR